MAPTETGVSDHPNSTARIRALARKGRRRLRWRHLLGVVAGLAVMTAALLTVVGRFTGHDHRVTKLWPVAVVAYLAGGLLATWALSRFKLDPVARRLPVVLVLHIAGVALVALRTSGDGDGGGSSPRRGGRLERPIDRAIDRVVARLPRWRPPEVPDLRIGHGARPGDDASERIEAEPGGGARQLDVGRGRRGRAGEGRERRRDGDHSADGRSACCHRVRRRYPRNRSAVFRVSPEIDRVSAPSPGAACG